MRYHALALSLRVGGGTILPTRRRRGRSTPASAALDIAFRWGRFANERRQPTLPFGGGASPTSEDNRHYPTWWPHRHGGRTDMVTAPTWWRPHRHGDSSRLMEAHRTGDCTGVHRTDGPSAPLTSTADDHRHETNQDVLPFSSTRTCCPLVAPGRWRRIEPAIVPENIEPAIVPENIEPAIVPENIAPAIVPEHVAGARRPVTIDQFGWSTTWHMVAVNIKMTCGIWTSWKSSVAVTNG